MENLPTKSTYHALNPGVGIVHELVSPRSSNCYEPTGFCWHTSMYYAWHLGPVVLTFTCDV